MKYIKFSIYALLIVMVISCTKGFDDINTNNSGFTASEVSAKYFLTSAQVDLYAPNRYPYWRAHLIHSDRYAGFFTFGHNHSWWGDDLGYNYSAGYTDASYDWLAGYFGKVKGFADLTNVGGEFENQYYYAMSLIMKGLYYQLYTDTFGMVPFSEAGVDGILTPKYDTQKDIYKGIIADLDNAMSIIGSAEVTGIGVEDAGSNDIYCGGDLQKWKRLANTLKLRIGMRALGAAGDDFASNAITSALSAPLLDETTGSVVMKKDFVISEWNSASYGDIWHDFGVGGGASWTMGETLIDLLRNNNDPRLAAYALPAPGGSFIFTDDGDANYQARLNFVIATLDANNATYTVTTSGADTTIDVPAGQYIGQPSRINGDTYDFVRYDMFSIPSEAVTHKRGTQVDTAYPEIILTSAESYFLQAEAVVRGLETGDAQSLFASGIKEAMKLWNISSGDADTYIANEAIADISSGTMDEKLEKIALQKWLTDYTDGFEAWAVVRDTGYPSNLAAGVSDATIFGLGTLNGAYPQRLRYGSSAQANPNFSAAISAQGPDVQGTKLWFAK